MEDKQTLTHSEVVSRAGKARAEKLSPERRREIAIQANHARKCYDRFEKATHDGQIEIAGHKIDCYVLKNGKRIVSSSAFSQVLGVSEPNKEMREKSVLTSTPYFAASDNLKLYMSEAFNGRQDMVEFISKSNKKTQGLVADSIPRICDAFLRARENNDLHPKQLKIATACEIIVRSLAKVGIIALIDEATGYQEERARNELQTLLKKFVQDELLPWTQTFPHEFFRQVYRIFGWKYIEGNTKNPQCLGGFINKHVYDAIDPEVKKALQEKNPFMPERNCNKYKHHQFLTEEYGRKALEKHLMTLIGLLRASRCKEEFEELFDRVFKGQSQLDWITQFL